MEENAAESTVTRGRLWLMVIICSIGGVMYGYGVGMISGALPFIGKHFNLMKELHGQLRLDPTKSAIIVAVFLGGAAVSTLITGPLSDIFGRRPLIIVSSLVFIAGTIVAAVATDFILVVTGRLIQGIGVGVVTIEVPLYLAEITPKDIRGRSTTMFQLFLTFGILMGYVVNLAFQGAPSSWNWRAVFLIATLPGAVLFLGSLFLPESPQWYYLKGRKEEAMKTLYRLRSIEEAEEEMAGLEKMKKAGEENRKQSGKQKVWRKYYLFPFLLSMSIIWLVQLTGINNVLQYSNQILGIAGLTGTVPQFLGAVGFGLINFVTTIFAVMLVDKMGRRPLIIIGSLGIIISTVFMGITSYVFNGVHTGHTTEGYLILVGCFIYLISFAIGPGVCIWLAASELLPLPIRGKGMGVNLFFASLVPAGYAALFLHIVNSIGLGGAFFLMGGTTLIMLLIAMFLLPETKGRSLEEVEQYFRDRYEKLHGKVA
ncbi:MAG: sugar porter family MFS transporter [Actinobacteria bacterium]|nr:sugar porter family MFS transporter [Actinomycetota bacterium]